MAVIPVRASLMYVVFRLAMKTLLLNASFRDEMTRHHHDDTYSTADL